MKYHESKKQATEESGTQRDVKGVPHEKVDGRHEHMRYSHHSMGEYKDGTHHHDHHRGKGD